MVGNFACEGLEFRSLNGVAEAGQALTCFSFSLCGLSSPFLLREGGLHIAVWEML